MARRASRSRCAIRCRSSPSSRARTRRTPLARRSPRAYGAGLPAPGKSSAGKGAVVPLVRRRSVVCDRRRLAEGALYRDLKETLDGLASCSDQSHGRVIMRVAGPRRAPCSPRARRSISIRASLRSGDSAVTQMAHVGVHLARTGDDAFELSVFRGFSENFWEWLTRWRKNSAIRSRRLCGNLWLALRNPCQRL